VIDGDPLPAGQGVFFCPRCLGMFWLIICQTFCSQG
jgi:hypothetical protein